MEEIGRTIIRLESVDSTNNYTANRVRANDLRHGSVILAVEQTKGRGQLGTVWDSQPGMNLTFSVFLDRVNLSVERQFFLTKIVSLSLVEFLSSFGIQSKIKWPNDIYVGDLKIAGVLIENTVGGSAIKKSIIGIGLNTNQKEFNGFPATSMRNETANSYSNDELLLSLLSRLNHYLKRIDDAGLEDLYLKNLYRMGEEHVFEDAEGTFKGTITGIDAIGRLLIRKGEKAMVYSLKEVSFMR